MDIEISSTEKKVLINQLIHRITDYYEQVNNYKVTPEFNSHQIKELVKDQFNLMKANNLYIINEILNSISSCSLHVTNPNYMGLFTPKTLFSSIIADIITSTYNPNLGSWAHAPYFVEVESFLINILCKKFGYENRASDGVFSSGGAEGNIYSMLCAVNNLSTIPNPILADSLVVYCSDESHHSIEKAAKVVGMGRIVITRLPTDKDLKIRINSLEQEIKTDISKKNIPLMIIGTAGTTGAGGLDDLQALSIISKKYEVWFHVDAAYGGALVFNNEYSKYLNGIEESDSISFDFHKWLAAPVGTNIFLTSNSTILHNIFKISADYMPDNYNRTVDPYSHSINWSRRAIGFKVYLTLLFYGWEGYSKLIENQIKLGKYFKKKFEVSGWAILNNSILPIICFTHSSIAGYNEKVLEICNTVVRSGKAWISTYNLKGTRVFRACITNLNTTETEVTNLLSILNIELEKYK